MASNPRSPALDGYRGALALAVVATHLFDLHTGLGSAAVVGFFGLSGMLLARPRGTLAGFLRRRAARTLPLYGVLLASLSATGPVQWVAWIPPLAWMQADATDMPRFALAPVWSLGVEETAYLLLPLLAGSRARLGLAWLAAVAAGVWARGHLAPAAAYHFGPGRLDAILLAALLTQVPAVRPLLRAATPWLAGAIVGGLAWGVVSWHSPILPVAAAGLALGLRDGDWPALGWALSARPLVWVGIRSYGVYLLHAPIMEAMPHARPWAVLAVTLAAAAVSWRWLEGPILRAAQRTASRSPAMLSVIAGGAVCKNHLIRT